MGEENKTLSKSSLLKNFKYAVLDRRNNRFHLMRDWGDVHIAVGDGSIQGGDVVVELDEGNTKVAITRNYTELE